MVKSKKNVLMIFGDHGDGITSVSSRFFRSAAKPFLEDQMKKKRPTVVLLEAQVPIDPAFIDGKSDEQLRALAREAVGPFRDFRLQTTSQINVLLSTGILPPDLELFGLGKDIVRLNRLNAGQVQIAFEPSEEETLYLDWKRYALSSSLSTEIEKLSELIKIIIELSFTRDRLLVNEISDLCAQDSRSVLSIRGYGHHGMVRIFDTEEFSVQSTVESHVPQFLFDAINERYTGPINDRRIQLYATLQLSMDLCFSREADPFMTKAEERRLMAKSRKHAIEKNKDTADELGILK